MFWKTLDLFWCQHYVGFESILHLFGVIVVKRTGLNGVQCISSGTLVKACPPSFFSSWDCLVLSPSCAGVFWEPVSELPRWQQNRASLSGCFWGTLPHPLQSTSPLWVFFCNVLSLFCKIPLIVMKWFLQPPFGNKWSLICVLSILNLSLRCFCCWRFLNEKKPSPWDLLLQCFLHLLILKDLWEFRSPGLASQNSLKKALQSRQKKSFVSFVYHKVGNPHLSQGSWALSTPWSRGHNSDLALTSPTLPTSTKVPGAHQAIFSKGSLSVRDIGTLC